MHISGVIYVFLNLKCYTWNLDLATKKNDKIVAYHSIIRKCYAINAWHVVNCIHFFYLHVPLSSPIYTYLYTGSNSSVFDLMCFHSLILWGELCVEDGEKRRRCVDRLRGGTVLVEPWGDDIRIGLHTTDLLWDNEHFIGDEIDSVLWGLALGITEVHHSSHVQITEVVPASTRQHL